MTTVSECTLVVLTATAVLAACGAPAAQPDRLPNTPISSVHVRPDIAPPPGKVGFPDVDAFQSADLDAYSGTNFHGDHFIAFKTDSGVSCFAYIYGNTALGGAPGIGAIDCNSREMPGFPPDAKGQELRNAAPAGTVFTDSVTRVSSNGSFEFRITRNAIDDSPKVLPAGRGLTLNGTGCAAGPDDLLACIEADRHGFVVSPSGSWAF